jgi:hypothetical protein
LASGTIDLTDSLPSGTVSSSAQVIEILSSLNSKTGSYATTGSNTFFGTQTYSGSVYIANDLIVQGSSSIQYISASSVSIGTNIVQLNTANPIVRFAGLSIIDSGSIGGSGSFLYDSVQDEFIFVHRGNGTNITSSHFVLGPETYDSLGNETYLTTNILSKGTGKEHLIDSCIFDNGTTTCIKNNLIGTGTISGTTIFGSTITCSPIGCFSTSCATTFIGGTISGTSATFAGNVIIRPSSGYNALFQVNSTTLRINYLNDAQDTNISAAYRATDFTWQNCTGQTSMVLASSGNLGIGTTPNTKLHIVTTAGENFQNAIKLEKAGGYGESIIQNYYSSVSNYGFGFDVAGSTKMVINNNGNVGINCTTPSYTLDVNGTGRFTSSVTSTNLVTGNAGLNVSSYGFLTQTVSGQMTILGHNIVASPSVANQVNVVNGSWYSSMVRLYYNEGITLHTSPNLYSANCVYPMGDTERVRITTIGNTELVKKGIAGVDGSYGNNLNFRLTQTNGQSIIAGGIAVQGQTGWGGDLVFLTHPANGTPDDNYTERVRISNDGQTRFQSSIILTNGQINSLGSGGGGQPMYLNFVGNGAIYAGSSYAVLYAGSDERIKSNIEDTNPTLNKILSLTPRTFKYKERPEFTNYGFIAQEVEEIMPELVKTADGITMCGDEEIVNQKSIESYGLAWAAILVKAIQEQQSIIQNLTNRIEQLENK